MLHERLGNGFRKKLSSYSIHLPNNLFHWSYALAPYRCRGRVWLCVWGCHLYTVQAWFNTLLIENMILSRFRSSVIFKVVTGSVLFAIAGCQSAPVPGPPTVTTPAETSVEVTSELKTATANPEASGQETLTDTAVAVEATEYSEQQCSASAFVADTDPAGLNVRAAASGEAAVIDTLPTDGPVEVTLVAAANGWLKLDVAWSLQQQELEEPGWVYAPLLGVTTRSGTSDTADGVPLRSTPDTSADITASLPQFTEVSLVSCSGDWLQVEADSTVGWLAAENQCSSPVTTCP